MIEDTLRHERDDYSDDTFIDSEESRVGLVGYLMLFSQTDLLVEAAGLMKNGSLGV